MNVPMNICIPVGMMRLFSQSSLLGRMSLDCFDTVEFLFYYFIISPLVLSLSSFRRIEVIRADISMNSVIGRIPLIILSASNGFVCRAPVMQLHASLYTLWSLLATESVFIRCHKKQNIMMLG